MLHHKNQKDRPLEAKFEKGCIAVFLFFALWCSMGGLLKNQFICRIVG